MIKYLALAITAASLTSLAPVAFAQDAASAPSPRAVGVSASTAQRAQSKAASSPDTGTLVRTAPTAEHDARSAAHHGKNAASPTHHRARRAKASASAASE